MSDLLIKNLELPKEDRIQLSVYPNGKVINHSSFTNTTLLSVELPSHGDWHTGTPTEDGWYLTETISRDTPYEVLKFENGKWFDYLDGVFEEVRDSYVKNWKKIED